MRIPVEEVIDLSGLCDNALDVTPLKTPLFLAGSDFLAQYVC